MSLSHVIPMYGVLWDVRTVAGGREFEEHSNGKGAYVKPVLRFMPARMVETESRVSECLGSGEE